MNSLLRASCFVCLAAVLSACGAAPDSFDRTDGGESRDGDPDVFPADAGAPDEDAGAGEEEPREAPLEAPIFSRDVAPIFAARCAGCHVARADIDLVTPGVVARLAARQGKCFRAQEVITGPLIAPGDPPRSLLWKRLVYSSDGLTESEEGCGRPMPADGAPLLHDHPEEVDVIARWIRAGARED